MPMGSSNASSGGVGSGRDNLFWWTVFLLTLAGVGIACWVGSFYIFGHPEKPWPYRFLNRLGKLPPPVRFLVTKAPPGEFLGAQKVFERYSKFTSLQLEHENELLLRNYIKNYAEAKRLVPYLTGTYTILKAYELQDSDLINSGVVALAQSDDFPQLLAELIYPTGHQNVAELLQMFRPGLGVKLEKTLDLSAILHVGHALDGRLQVTTMPLLYGSYAVKNGDGSFSLEPPATIKVSAGFPLVRGEEVRSVLYEQSELRRRRLASKQPLGPESGSGPQLVRKDFEGSPSEVPSGPNAVAVPSAVVLSVPAPKVSEAPAEVVQNGTSGGVSPVSITNAGPPTLESPKAALVASSSRLDSEKKSVAVGSPRETGSAVGAPMGTVSKKTESPSPTMGSAANNSGKISRTPSENAVAQAFAAAPPPTGLSGTPSSPGAVVRAEVAKGNSLAASGVSSANGNSKLPNKEKESGSKSVGSTPQQGSSGPQLAQNNPPRGSVGSSGPGPSQLGAPSQAPVSLATTRSQVTASVSGEPKAFVAANPTTMTPPAPNGGWKTYGSGQQPGGRVVSTEQATAFADRTDAGRLYLRGQFVVTATGNGRAVLRQARVDDRAPQARVIVEYPAGAVPPAQGSSIARDDGRGFEIREVRKSPDGQINIFVREISAP